MLPRTDSRGRVYWEPIHTPMRHAGMLLAYGSTKQAAKRTLMGLLRYPARKAKRAVMDAALYLKASL